MDGLKPLLPQFVDQDHRQAIDIITKPTIRRDEIAVCLSVLLCTLQISIILVSYGKHAV